MYEIGQELYDSYKNISFMIKSLQLSFGMVCVSFCPLRKFRKKETQQDILWSNDHFKSSSEWILSQATNNTYMLTLAINIWYNKQMPLTKTIAGI